MQYDKIYYHDYHGWRDTKTDAEEAFNVFVAENGELLKSVSFITAEDSVYYTVAIYDSFEEGQLSGLLSETSGLIEFSGFHTIDLDNPINMTRHHTYYFYLYLPTGGLPYDCTSDVPVLLCAKYRATVVSSANPGESYYRADNVWYDLTSLDSTANFCIKGLSMLGVSFEADSTRGWVPLDVNFSGSSVLEVDEWSWDFGNGDSADICDIKYTYLTPGVHDVTLKVDADGDIRSLTEENCIIALADTLIGGSGQAEAGQTAELIIYGNNNVPLDLLTIPVSYSGDLFLTLDSFSTAGCLTDMFEIKVNTIFDPFNSRSVFTFYNVSDSATPLSPGYGPFIKLYFKIPAGAGIEQTTSIKLDTVLSYPPRFYCELIDYEPKTIAGLISLPFICGDVNNDDVVNIFDVTYLINHLYKGGLPPSPSFSGNVNSDDNLNIFDVTYLISYLYRDGYDLECRDIE